jgi:hypothetical protein
MSETNVYGISYNKVTKSMLVHYTGGASHSYSPVTYDEFITCLTAENLSRAVHQVVRKGNLVGKKVEA